MLGIALPLALAELGWMAMGVVDTIMVGRLPESAIAIGATSIGNAAFYGLGIFGLGLLSGLDAVISQAFGAGDMPAARRGIVSGLVLSAIVTPILMAGIYGITAVLGAIGIEPSVLLQATAFARTSVVPSAADAVLGLPAISAGDSLRAASHVCADQRKPGEHAVQLAPHLRALGAPGDGPSRFGAFDRPGEGVSGWCAVPRREAADPGAFNRLQTMRSEVWRLFRLGLPAGLTILFEVGVFDSASVLIGKLDPASIAANAIAMNAVSVTYMVPLGIGAAAAVSVGKGIGAGDRHGAMRAGWTAIGLAVAFAACATCAFLLLPQQIASVFTRTRR